LKPTANQLVSELWIAAVSKWLYHISKHFEAQVFQVHAKVVLVFGFVSSR